MRKKNHKNKNFDSDISINLVEKDVNINFCRYNENEIDIQNNDYIDPGYLADEEIEFDLDIKKKYKNDEIEIQPNINNMVKNKDLSRILSKIFNNSEKEIFDKDDSNELKMDIEQKNLSNNYENLLKKLELTKKCTIKSSKIK